MQAAADSSGAGSAGRRRLLRQSRSIWALTAAPRELLPGRGRRRGHEGRAAASHESGSFSEATRLDTRRRGPRLHRGGLGLPLPAPALRLSRQQLAPSGARQGADRRREGLARCLRPHTLHAACSVQGVQDRLHVPHPGQLAV